MREMQHVVAAGSHLRHSKERDPVPEKQKIKEKKNVPPPSPLLLLL
jgi:hypothetical protein